MTKLICDCCKKEISPPECFFLTLVNDTESVRESSDLCKDCANKVLYLVDTGEDEK